MVTSAVTEKHQGNQQHVPNGYRLPDYRSFVTRARAYVRDEVTK
jgi:hypothetical protein